MRLASCLLRPLALVATLGASYAAPAPVAPISAPSDVSVELPALLAAHQIPGMVVLALRGDEIIAQGAAGVRQVGAPERITLADKFHLGSCTKAMTATLVALLVERGSVAWTSTLGEIFADIRPPMLPAWKPVTLQQVLAHRAGIANNPSGPLRESLARGEKTAPQQRREIIAQVLAHPPLSPPGATYSYSNIGYMFAGALVEQLEKRPWADVMRERLYQPLDQTSAGFGPVGTAAALDQPRGHTADGRPRPAGADNPAYYGPAGTAHMNIADWAKFAALHLRGDPANPHAHARLLQPATFAAMHALPSEGNYNSGWLVQNRAWARGDRPTDTGRTITHSGSNTMYYCTVWIAPETDFAALVACNQGGDAAGKACDAAIGLLVKKFARRPPAP